MNIWTKLLLALMAAVIILMVLPFVFLPLMMARVIETNAFTVTLALVGMFIDIAAFVYTL
jgi:hypothetical protein